MRHTPARDHARALSALRVGIFGVLGIVGILAVILVGVPGVLWLFASLLNGGPL